MSIISGMDSPHRWVHGGLGAESFRPSTIGQAVIAPTGAIPIGPNCDEMRAIVIDDGGQSVSHHPRLTSDLERRERLRVRACIGREFEI